MRDGAVRVCALRVVRGQRKESCARGNTKQRWGEVGYAVGTARTPGTSCVAFTTSTSHSCSLT